MRNVVIASGDLNNIGDFALLMQCVQGIRRIGLTCPILVRQWVTPPPGILRELEQSGVAVLSGKDVLGSLRAAYGSLVMVGGGQMVRDNASIKSLTLLAGMMEIAHRTGGLTAVLGCGVSRLQRTTHRTLWRRILSSASVLTTRDDVSRLEVSRLCGSSAQPILTADLAFCPTALHAALTRSIRTETIVVAPCDDPSEDRRIDVPALAELSISAAQAFNVGVISLVAHDSGPSMDPIVCKTLEAEIRSRAPALRIAQIASNRISDYTETYSGSSLVITNRLHSVIFGLLAGKPLLVLDDGGAKTIAAAQRFDLPTIKLGEPTTDAALGRLVDEASRGPSERRRSQMEAATTASLRNFELLEAAIGDRR